MFYIDNLKIRDELGRERIFKGVNACFKLKDINQRNVKWKGYDKLFDSLESNGVNIVRLGFTWSMLEPIENQYDSKAFDMLKNYVKLCKDKGIYVLLDLHQDLFYCNKGIGDGAPDWATKEYKKKHPLLIWAEGYFYMKDIQRAFNDFWDNKNGMQDKVISLWKRIVLEFSGYDNVIAYDYFNEPLIYGNSNKVFCTLINGACKQGLGFDFNAEKYFEKGNERRGFMKMALALLIKIKSGKRLKKLLYTLNDYNAFASVVEACRPYTYEFDKSYYQPFLQRVINACGDEKHLNFFEHSYYSNLGLPFEVDLGERYVYSPHAYDIFIDSPLYNKYSSDERIKYIIDNIRKNQLNMNVPVVMGEWGGGANHGNQWLKHIDYIYSLLEENHWSCIYWGYRGENKEFVNMINRPYPVAVCGNIVSYKTDSKARSFELIYNCDKDFKNAKTVVYTPDKGFVEYDYKQGKNIIKFNY